MREGICDFFNGKFLLLPREGAIIFDWISLVFARTHKWNHHAHDTGDWQPVVKGCSRITQALLCCVIVPGCFQMLLVIIAIGWRVLPPSFLLGEIWSHQAGCLGCYRTSLQMKQITFFQYPIYCYQACSHPVPPNQQSGCCLMFTIRKAVLYKSTVGKLDRHLSKSFFYFR